MLFPGLLRGPARRLLRHAPAPAAASCRLLSLNVPRYRRKNKQVVTDEVDKHEDQWQLTRVVEAWLARDPTMTLEAAFRELEVMVGEYRQTDSSELYSTRLAGLAPLVPKYGYFFTDLPLHQAYLEFDAAHRMSLRKHVPPSEDELRQIFNISQVRMCVCVCGWWWVGGWGGAQSGGCHDDHTVCYIVTSLPRVDSIATTLLHPVDTRVYELVGSGAMDRLHESPHEPPQ